MHCRGAVLRPHMHQVQGITDNRRFLSFTDCGGDGGAKIYAATNIFPLKISGNWRIAA